jgi:hypothetical protein
MVRISKINKYLLNKADIAEYAAMHNTYEELVEFIYMRVKYIAEVISNVFGVEFTSFIFEDACSTHINTDYGDFYEAILSVLAGTDDVVHWELYVYPDKVLNYYTQEGHTICLNKCFPYNWLFTDFEAELKRAIKDKQQVKTPIENVITINHHVKPALFEANLNTDIINTLTMRELADLYYIVSDVLYNIQFQIDTRGKESN